MRIAGCVGYLCGEFSAFVAMNFLSPDLLLDLIAVENVGTIGLLIWLALRVLKLEQSKPLSEKVDATLEAIDGTAVNAYGLTQDILASVRAGYELGKGFIGEVRTANADGTTMVEAEKLTDSGKQTYRGIKSEISDVVNEILDGGDTA